MRPSFPFALLGLALCAHPLAATEKPAADPAGAPLACSAVFGPQSSEALLIETFGADNVTTGLVPGPEGTQMLATTVFPDDPGRAMQFGWFDEESRSYLNYVELAPGQTAPGGVRLGMSVAEVEALNGERFNVGGFWWDYGGYANIESGALAGEQDGGCYLSIRFAPADEAIGDLDISPVAGEVQVPSSEPLLETLDTRVQVLSIGYAWPDELPQPEY